MSLPLTKLPVRLVTFLREAREELRKVSWPSRELTLRYTLIVVISSLVVGAVLGGIDYVLIFILETVV